MDVVVTDAVGNRRRARVLSSSTGPIAGLCYDVSFDDGGETRVVAARVKRAKAKADESTFAGWLRSRRPSDNARGVAIRFLNAFLDENPGTEIDGEDDLNKVIAKARASDTTRWAARELLFEFLKGCGEA